MVTSARVLNVVGHLPTVIPMEQTTTPSDRHDRQPPAHLGVRADVGDVAALTGATDALVFQHTHGRSHVLLGGLGRGAEWAGTVAVEERDEPRLVAAAEGQIVRVRKDVPTRIIGPYYARTAAIVSLHGATIVLGGHDDWLGGTDEDVLVQACAQVAAGLSGTVPTRDLEHELRLYGRLKSLLEPVGDRQATAHHLAREAADLLAVDYVLLLPEPGADLAVARPSWTPPHADGLREVADLIVAALPEDVLVIQDVHDAPLPSPLSPGDGVISTMIIPLTTQGFLLAAHASGRPRGFTSMDTDVGSLLAETASVALAAADASTTLDRHAERVRWLLRRDPLTGLPDRRAWDDALEATVSGSVVSVGLGAPSVSEQVLQIIGAVLERQATDTDLVARVGAVEFGLLLRGADADTAAQIADAIRGRLGPLGQSDGQEIGIGLATCPPQATVQVAWRVAAGQMLQGTGRP